MPSIIVRDLDKKIILEIERLAKKKGVSREKYVRDVLKNHVLDGEVKEIEGKYCALAEETITQIQLLTDLTEKNNDSINLILACLKEDEQDAENF